MSEDNKDKTVKPLEAGGLPITIHTQYLRDISFENPNAPDSLRAGQPMPEMEVNIGMDARYLNDGKIKNLYEVALNISAIARRGDKKVFIAEVVYAATVSINEDVPEDQHHPILLIEIPRYIFPFARQALATITSQGGYPPLLLNPVDFQTLYFERFKEEIEAAMRDEAGREEKETAETIN